MHVLKRLLSRYSFSRRKYFRGMIALLGSLLIMSLSGVISAPIHAATPGQQTTVIIDSVTVTVTSAVSSGSIFATTRPGDAAQRAIAVSYNPYHSFSIEAIPYGSSGEEEGLPPAQAGSATTYRSLLSKGWQQKQAAQAAPSITIFGRSIAGTLYHVSTLLDSLTAKPAIVEEWVTEAGSRIWIVRIIQEQTANFSLAKLAAQVQGTMLTSTTLSQPTTLKSGQATKKPSVRVAATASNNPPWWNGTLCDTAHHPTAYSLGSAGLNGVIPCGPRPAYDSDSYGDLLVNFYSGAWGQLEWECVELSMRYMYMVDGINPYPANGNAVVGNYNNSSDFSLYNSGNPNVSKLQTYSSNGNQVGPISAGDILSWNTGTSAGHTSVVQSASLDGNGNGSLTTMEENGSSNGNFTYSVSNWVVNTSGYGTILGWLHHPNSNPISGGYHHMSGFSQFGTSRYQLHSDGSIYKYLGTPLTGWQMLDNNVKAVAIATDGTGNLYQLHNDGSIYKYLGTPLTGWQMLDNNVKAIAIAADGTGHLYQLHSDGSIYIYLGTPLTGWQMLDNNVKATAIAADGTGDLYQLHSDGSIYKYLGTPLTGWQMLDNNVKAIALSGAY